MKILTTLSYYSPHRTGLTIYAQRLAEALVRRGHEVTVLTCQYNKDLLPEESINGVDVVRVPALLRISRGMVMPTFPMYAYRLIKRNDIVLINTPMLEASIVTMLARRLRKKVLIAHHGDLRLPRGALNRFIEKCVFAIYEHAATSASVIVGYSNDYIEHSSYLSCFRDKAVAIYPPIEFPGSSDLRAMMLRRELGLEGCRVIGYSGRFVEEKRPDRLLRAIPYLLERMTNIKVVFAGEYRILYESFFDRCKPLIDRFQDHVLFLGLIENEQRVADFYTMCDVIVMPSETECFALVQVEAMLCGTPVVVNNIPGAREPVRVTGMGEIVDCESEHALSEAIIRVIENKHLYVKPRHLIEKLFDLAHTVDQYEDLFRRCR